MSRNNASEEGVDENTEKENGESDTDDCLSDISIFLEGSQPGSVETFHFSSSKGAIIVAIHRIDEEPGALQSGHYLWPAAKLLADYIVADTLELKNVTSILELGAGCALASLTALQALQTSLQAVVISDHDPGTLERARDNYESTLEQIMDSMVSEEELDTAINSLASIPVEFCDYAWGEPVSGLVRVLEEHLTASVKTNTFPSFDLILASDVVYGLNTVGPLVKTIAEVLGGPNSSRCLLSQSFKYSADLEEAMNEQCRHYGLVRSTIFEDTGGSNRIQQLQREKRC